MHRVRVCPDRVPRRERLGVRQLIRVVLLLLLLLLVVVVRVGVVVATNPRVAQQRTTRGCVVKP